MAWTKPVLVAPAVHFAQIVSTADRTLLVGNQPRSIDEPVGHGASVAIIATDGARIETPDTPGPAVFPLAAAVHRQMHLVWGTADRAQDNAPWYLYRPTALWASSRLDDGRWSPGSRLPVENFRWSNGTPREIVEHPHGIALLVLGAPPSFGVWLLRSDDGNWSREPVGEVRSAAYGSVAGCGNAVHVAYIAAAPNPASSDVNSVFYLHSADGQRWSAVDTVHLSGELPALAVKILCTPAGRPVIVWMQSESGGGRSVRVASGRTEDGTWVERPPLAITPATRGLSALAAGDGVVHVAFDHLDGRGMSSHVDYNALAPHGTWGETQHLFQELAAGGAILGRTARGGLALHFLSSTKGYNAMESYVSELQ